MRKAAALALFAVGVCLGGAGPLRAETTVEVLATDPPGDAVTLGPRERFYLRIAYSTDEPVHIWAQPYFRGEPARAGSNPSGTYSGRGETLGWFFLLEPDARVDEVRITVGDGSRAGTRVLATYPVRAAGSAGAARSAARPTWVAELEARAEAARRADYEKRMSEPPSAGDTLLLTGLTLAVCAIGLLGVALPFWALRRWRGGWRVAAAVPAAMMLFAVMRIGVGVSIDPTSHNLWPFEILQTALLSAAVVGVLMLARRVTGARSA